MDEAYPIIPWEERCPARVCRCRHGPAIGNASMHGTLSMFEREEFKVVRPMGRAMWLSERQWSVARGEEQKSGTITDKGALSPVVGELVGELDYQGNCASPIDSVSEVPIWQTLSALSRGVLEGNYVNG